MRAVLFVKTLLFCDKLVAILPRFKCSEGKRALIVRVDAIGDFILWLDAAKDLRKIPILNQHKITLLCNSICYDIAVKTGYFDEVIPLARDKFIFNIYYRLKTLYSIKNGAYNVAVQPTYSREILFGDSIIKASGANVRIASNGDYTNITAKEKNISDNWYTNIIPAKKELIMELLRNEEFMRGLDIPSFTANIPQIRFENIENEVLDYGKYFIIFLGSGDPRRRWPDERFIELANRIREATKWNCIFCSGPRDKLNIKEFSKNTHYNYRYFLGKNHLPLNKLIDLITKAQLLIGSETGAVHLAAALNVPSLCVLGGCYYGRFLPYEIKNTKTQNLPSVVFSRMDCFGCNCICKYGNSHNKPFPCINRIIVNDVWLGAQNLIEKNNCLEC